MQFRTIVDTPKPNWGIAPGNRLLFVGSCFADSIGSRFRDNQFRATVNPYGVMYNPASVLHTVQRCETVADVVFLTLGTNHVYILRETGEIVDNCQKRPQRLFSEQTLSVEQCVGYLEQAVSLLAERNPRVRVVFTVSPIRYAKYGFHGSQLSKATLLLAVDSLLASGKLRERCEYFPAYELVCDELRDYRFYKEDMLHPSAQAVEYIWQRLSETYLSAEARRFVAEWQPIAQALGHKPFNPDSAEYRQFAEQTRERLAAFRQKYGLDSPTPQKEP